MFSSIAFGAYILFIYLSKIEEHKNQIDELKKSFKRAEDLIDIRAEIKSLSERLK